MDKLISTAETADVEIDWDAWTVEKLQKCLKTLGLSFDGKKLMLILRLQDYVNKNGPDCLSESFYMDVSEDDSDEEEDDFVVEKNEDGEEVKRPTKLQFATDLISSEKSRTIRLFHITQEMFGNIYLQTAFTKSESFLIRFCPNESEMFKFNKSDNKNGIAEIRFKTFTDALTFTELFKTELPNITVQHLKSTTKGVMRYWDNNFSTIKNIKSDEDTKIVNQREDAAIRTIVFYHIDNDTSEELIVEALNLKVPFTIFLPRTADRQTKGYFYLSFPSSKIANEIYNKALEKPFILSGVMLKMTFFDGVNVSNAGFITFTSDKSLKTEEFSFSSAGEMLPYPELLSVIRRKKMEQMVRNLHIKVKECGSDNQMVSAIMKKITKIQQKLLLDKVLKMNMGTWNIPKYKPKVPKIVTGAVPKKAPFNRAKQDIKVDNKIKNPINEFKNKNKRRKDNKNPNFPNKSFDGTRPPNSKNYGKKNQSNDYKKNDYYNKSYNPRSVQSSYSFQQMKPPSLPQPDFNRVASYLQSFGNYQPTSPKSDVYLNNMQTGTPYDHNQHDYHSGDNWDQYRKLPGPGSSPHYY